MKNSIYKVMLLLLVAHFLVSGCGTKTKTQTETKTEITAKEIAKEQDSLALMEKTILSKVDEKMKELEQKFRENEKKLETETTVVEAVEVDSKEPVFMEISDGRFLNVNNGRITKTKTTTTKNKQSEKSTEIDTKKIEQEKRKSDSLAIATAIQTGIKEGMSELSVKDQQTNKVVEQEGWQPGFWFWFWIILILLILIAILVFRKWLLLQFPFLNVFRI